MSLTFSSVSHALHWSFLLESGAPLEVRSCRAHVASGPETRAIDVGDLAPSDLRAICAAGLRDARARLSRHQWAALQARFGHGATRAAGFAVLVEGCAGMADADLTADAIGLFADGPAETPGARLLSGVRSALVAHAIASLGPSFMAPHVA